MCSSQPPRPDRPDSGHQSLEYSASIQKAVAPAFPDTVEQLEAFNCLGNLGVPQMRNWPRLSLPSGGSALLPESLFPGLGSWQMELQPGTRSPISRIEGPLAFLPDSSFPLQGHGDDDKGHVHF